MWSRKYNKCINCGTKEKKHEGKGMCEECYPKKWYKINLEKVKEKAKKYQEDNREKVNELACKRYKLNPEKYRLKKKEYRKRNPDKNEKGRQFTRIWQKNNRERRNKYIKSKLKKDSNYKVSCYLRNRLNIALKNNQKAGSAVKDLGCSIPEFKIYLEKLFQRGMSWNNYGFYGWHIDHKIPLSKFNLTEKEQLLKACHFTNLQPLWAKDNWEKNNKLINN